MLKVTDITQELDILLGSAHSTVHNQTAYRKKCVHVWDRSGYSLC